MSRPVPPTDARTDDDRGGCNRVLLVHGLWNAGWWLAPLARRLRRQGFQVENFSYPSIVGGPEPAIEALVTRLRRGPTRHLVGHSLGGMIALEAVRRTPDLPVARLACMGSPLRGSRVAQALASRPRLAWALGSSRALLQSGCEPWEGRVQVGMVAGDVARGVGRLLGVTDARSDGTVSLAETRLPGLTAHCSVHASHTGLVFSAEAARQVAAFLRTGTFLGGDGRHRDSGAAAGGPV